MPVSRNYVHDILLHTLRMRDTLAEEGEPAASKAAHELALVLWKLTKPTEVATPAAAAASAQTASNTVGESVTSVVDGDDPRNPFGDHDELAAEAATSDINDPFAGL